MSATDALQAPAYRRPVTINAERLREGVVWLGVLTGFVVMFEPAPYDLIMALAIVLFIGTGLKLPQSLFLFLFLVALYQCGAVITLIMIYDQPNVARWTMIGVFLAVTGCFHALFLYERTEIRANLIVNAWVIAAVLSGLLAFIGYFKMVPFYESLLRYGRAKGAFKDANVYAPYLVFPALVLMQRIYSSDLKRALVSMLWLGIIACGVLLSFSRGSWGHMVMSAAVMTVLSTLAAPSPAARARILVICLVAIGVSALIVVGLLQIPAVGKLFVERASLEQYYDVGHGGRFTNHILGFRLALEKPFGVGIFQFAKLFGADVHNTYLNGLMSYGWLGGLSLISLTLITLVLGIRDVLKPAPWRPIFICVFSTWVVLIGEAAVIDVDHWRHQWALLGMMWGFIAAQRARELRWAKTARTPAPQEAAAVA